MYGYRTILFLDGSPYAYELGNFSISFSQPVDRKGKAQNEMKAGVMEMMYESLPSIELTKWMINPRNYRNGRVKIYGEDESVVQEIVFEKATCIGMNVRYMESGSGYCMSLLQVQALSITIDNLLVENNWKNVQK